jgi:hypothetical protein
MTFLTDTVAEVGAQATAQVAGPAAKSVGKKVLTAVVGEAHPLNAHWLQSAEAGSLELKPAAPGKNKVLTIYVNGILRKPEEALWTARQISEQDGTPVHVLYNGTHHGLLGDGAEFVRDSLDLGESAMVNALAAEILKQVRLGQPIRLIGHSHGSLIVDEANRKVLEELGPDTARMTLIQVETWGRARGNFVNGPQYVHYIDEGDVVVGAFGRGGNNGKGAVVCSFSRGKIFGSHPARNYLRYRISFDAARRGEFKGIPREDTWTDR